MHHVAKAETARSSAAVTGRERAVIEPEPCGVPTAYIAADSTGVPMRSAETAGKRPDGSGDTCESKLDTFWTPEAVNAQGHSERVRNRPHSPSAYGS